MPKRERTPEYFAYHNAKQRCQNINNKNYRDYGGRGIEFRFKSFEEFIGHIGLKPSPNLTLDRIKNEGHYKKGNVRWVSQFVQIHNSRFYDRSGENNPNAKLDSVQVIKIRSLKGTLSVRKAARLFKISPSHLHEIWSGKKWREV